MYTLSINRRQGPASFRPAEWDIFCSRHLSQLISINVAKMIADVNYILRVCLVLVKYALTQPVVRTEQWHECC